jgi:hypothetical protein
MKLLEDELFEMANLHRKESNLPVNLYFTGNGFHGITCYNCLRVKVQQDIADRVDETNMSVLVFKTNENWDILNIDKVGEFKLRSRDLNKIIKYIKYNWNTIVNHWVGKLTDYEFLSVLLSKNKN